MLIDRLIPFPLDKAAGKEYAKRVFKDFYGESAVRAEYLGGGSFGKAYSVKGKGGEVVVKFMLCDGMLEKETADLSLIGEKLEVKCPKVLYVRKKDEHIPYDCYVMEKIDGKPLIFSVKHFFASRKKRFELGEKIVEGLRSLHENTADKFGESENPNCDKWTDYYRPFAEKVLSKAEMYAEKGELDGHIVSVMKKFMEKFDVVFAEEPDKPRLIHGDLNVCNIMVKDGEIAFIDPLNSLYADVEYDLFQFYNLTGKRFFLGKIYRQKYGESAFCEAKLAFYGLWNEVFCFIKSGIVVPFIMNPLVKNAEKVLRNLD